jgi:ornithine cyclodeaminase
MTATPTFAVISGAEVHASLEGREREIVELVESAYGLHDDGCSVSPATYSMRFPDRPTARINALPASLGGDVRAHGLKWISSFPENVGAGIPRASAVVILNDYDSGYPYACLEGSIISAERTAAFAALAADRLSEGARPARVGFFGTGLIARYVHTFLTAIDWPFEAVGVHDLSAESVAGFRGYLESSANGEAITVHESAEGLIRSSDLVVFATVASEPHVGELSWFDHNPLVLHVSLRDLAPEIVLASTNIVDDVEHCLAGNTSPHLAEQLTGNRDFIDGTLGDVIAGRVKVPADRPLLFSPYGLGVLDLALGSYVYDRLAEAGELRTIDGFFHELSRHGRAAESAAVVAG